MPPETFEYRLGNRSGLDWVIGQHQVSADKRSGIINDTFPWPQFDVSPSAVRRDIVVGPRSKNRRSSVGATSPDVAPDGAKPKSTAADYKDAAPDGAELSKDALVKIDAVAAAARELRRVRAESLPKMKDDLHSPYCTLELPGVNPLRDTHAALDAAVLTAYGFNAKKDLLALNRKSPRNLKKDHPSPPPTCPRIIPTRRSW